MVVNAKDQHYLLFLNKNQLEALELALRDTLEQHEENDLFAPRTVNDMRMVLSDIHELIP